MVELVFLRRSPHLWLVTLFCKEPEVWYSYLEGIKMNF